MSDKCEFYLNNVIIIKIYTFKNLLSKYFQKEKKKALFRMTCLTKMYEMRIKQYGMKKKSSKFQQ